MSIPDPRIRVVNGGRILGSGGSSLFNASCARHNYQDTLLIMTGEEDHRPGTAALRLRALAHPLRWKLLDLLSSEGSATATRCAGVLSESVASCSYHLGILGKYGYIEPVPGTSGREKPWRPASSSQDLTPGPDASPEEELAAEAAAEAFLEHEAERMKTRLRRVGLEPPEWRAASIASGSTMHVTASELREIRDELMTVLLRYQDRDEDPRLRPPGAREARVFFSTSVNPPR
jgi:hypothetical protein